MNPDTYTDESDCFPLTPAQLLARDEAWPQFSGAGQVFTLPGGVLLKMLPVPGTGLMFGKFPITQAQWQAVMGGNPSHFKGESLPVESVSWHDCQRLCKKLSAITGREFRLPTSAEWEVALAGQVASLDTGWFSENSGEMTHPVGQKQPNALGLHDVLGNVWEWCEDGEDGYKLLRGGSWFYDRVFARSVCRNVYHPADRDIVVGCRVVCVVRPPSSLDSDPRVAQFPEALRRAWAEHCGVDDPGPDWDPDDLGRFDREQFDLFRAGWDARALGD